MLEALSIALIIFALVLCAVLAWRAVESARNHRASLRYYERETIRDEQAYRRRRLNDRAELAYWLLLSVVVAGYAWRKLR